MTGVESLCRTLPEVGAEALTVAELGTEISRHLSRVVPHDGYMLVGLDPLSGAGCLHAKEHGYRTEVARLLERADTFGLDVQPFAQLMTGPSQVGVTSVDSAESRHSIRVHEVMVSEGFCSEMRIALTARGIVWGALVLVRELGRRSFSVAEETCAQRLVPAVAAAIERFVRAKALRPSRTELPPGVLLVDANDSITMATPSAHGWLAELTRHCAQVDGGELHGIIWNITYLARRRAGPALSRVPTPNGWVAVHAQPADTAPTANIAVTIQPAPTALLLPAVATWYGLTAREHSIVEQALDGLPANQIARRLQLSPHTVNDHFKSIYRKIGVNSRDQLIAGITA
ncbi:helix-turn-helix transcriptional regulator [Nocardia brasiliensis]|uniref:helix-turn-helix transcriptional regulator n=1 Tax=Nocardia brasiliensis TaxID=37326 RepID=UPI00366E05FA